MRGADLLIHECYFSDENQARAKETGHSWTSLVQRLASRAGVKQLALMHLNPLDQRDDPTDQAHASTPFPKVMIGRDGMEIEF